MLKPILIIVFGFIFSNQTRDNFLVWSEKPLTFEDFQTANSEKKDKVRGEFIAKITWTREEVTGEIPKYKFYAKMDKNASWMSVKHKDLLNEYQFFWNITELYTRKIRKEVEELRIKKNNNDADYKKVLRDNLIKLQKQRNKYENLINSQPDFFRILNKQYQDSLVIYKSYK